MSEREELAQWFHDTTLDCAHRGDIHECVLRARNLLESDWLAARDARIREEALKPVRALADEWEAVRSGVTSPGLYRAADELRAIADAIKADNDKAKRDDYAAVIDTPAQAQEACTTPGCNGDGRYSAPGRGHRDDCHYPLDTPAQADGTVEA